MRYAFSAILGIALVACSSLEPVPIRAGDVCFRCGRVITDTRMAAQIIRDDGHASTFRTPACLARYLQEHPNEAKNIYVTDHSSGKLVSVANALFVRTTIDEKTRERDFYAFKSAAEAGKFAKESYSGAVDWTMVRTIVAAESKGD